MVVEISLHIDLITALPRGSVSFRGKNTRCWASSMFQTYKLLRFAPKADRNGALSQDTAKLMVFKLITAAAKTWRKLKGENQLPNVIQGVKFRDGIEVSVPTSQSAA